MKQLQLYLSNLPTLKLLSSSNGGIAEFPMSPFSIWKWDGEDWTEAISLKLLTDSPGCYEAPALTHTHWEILQNCTCVSEKMDLLTLSFPPAGFRSRFAVKADVETDWILYGSSDNPLMILVFKMEIQNSNLHNGSQSKYKSHININEVWIKNHMGIQEKCCCTEYQLTLLAELPSKTDLL